MDRFANTKYLTGLRALGVLMVFAVHITTGYTFSNRYLENLNYMNRYGVILFFILSAYTVYMSIDKSIKFSFSKYMQKRILRIIPLFYFILVIAFIFGGSKGYQEIFNINNDWKNLFMNLSFLNLFDIRYRQSLINVSWTLPIEMLMYTILPLFFLILKKNTRRIIDILLITLIISYTSQNIFLRFYPPEYREFALIWSPLFYLFTYALGIAIYLIVKNQVIKFRFSSFHLTLAFALFFIFPWILVTSNLLLNVAFMTIWSGLLILFSTSQNKLSQLIFENPIALYIGKISYSIYLIHYTIIQLVPSQNYNIYVKAAIVLGITIFLSHLTYTFIEKPFINLANKPA